MPENSHSVRTSFTGQDHSSLFPSWPSYTGWFERANELEAWLQTQPIQASTVLAYRIGARCLPGVRSLRDLEQDAGPYDAHDRRHVMAAFRSLAASRLYLRHPSQALREAALHMKVRVAGSVTAASAVIFESSQSVYSGSDDQADRSITLAVLAARGAHQVLADPLTGRTGTGRFWPAIAADATWLTTRPDPMALLNEPLWLGSNEASQPTEEIAALWATLRAALEEHDPNWNVWTHWYQKQIDGTLDEPLALELYRLTLIPDAEARIQATTNGPQFLSNEAGTSRLSWNEQDPANQQWLDEVKSRAKLYSGDPKRANRMVRTFFDKWAEAHAQPDAVERKAVTSDKTNRADLSDKDIRSLLLCRAEESIAFRPLFPPDFTRSSLTFFGGLPIAPSNFLWPKAPQEPQDPTSLASLTFLGQIDCRTLPDIPSRDLLPRTGILYFFVDWLLVEGAISYPTPYDSVVVHEDGDLSDAIEQVPPEDLVFCYGRDRGYYYSWLSRTSPEMRVYPKTFPKWTMEPVRLRTLKDAIPPEVDDASIERAHALQKEEQHQALIEAFGEPVSTQTGSVPKPLSGLWRPSARFPEAWLFVEILAGEMLYKLDRRPSSFGRLPGTPAPSPEKLEARAAACREATQQASEWVETARRNGLYCAVSDADRSAVLSWLEALAAPSEEELERAFRISEINRVINKAVQEGTSPLLSHSAETAALIGVELRALTLYRHRAFVSDVVKSTTRHQMLGTGLAIQDAVERYGESHVLLAQFDSDAGLGWMWGDLGALQFWITPEDLAARRFDQVVLTMDGF